ncbi:hypothetical protein F2P81_011210 [Scophthalmus maximus]|uniref:Basement membrane-specific heparan sulfate proteoglycan core protein n=1 Tax=Scophthalmus maximus TaxID=52904 RepID=A0A6A4SUU7_SCOMX|nr:hypothetical protein F2P81_011210 [Scophthalmus maximus]
MEEFQLVDLSRRFLNLDSFWILPRQFLGNKIDSYGGSLKFKVRYTLARGLSEPVEKPDVMLVGNGRRLVYRRGSATPSQVVNQKEIKFTEDKWQHSNGRPVTREELMMTLASLDSVSIRTNYDHHMVSVGLSDIVMDTTTVEFSTLGHAREVEECRCPPGYSGLSCEVCSSGFERVPGGSYLGTCAGCNCNGHASACDPISGHCLSCQHNTEGPQCDKCRPGYFGDPSRGRPDDCKPCPCPYYETSRRFSDTCFLDVDQQPTCDACRLGYTGRRCEKCAPGYQGNPLLPNGKCIPNQSSKCDNRGTLSSSSRPCSCKNNVAGAVCDECKAGFFHLSQANPEGCLRCFCMGVTKQCASSTWNRDQVRGGVNGQLFSLSDSANTKTISDGISQSGFSEVVYRSFSSVPNDIYYWVLPESFRGDKVTAYGGELRYTVRFAPLQRSPVIDGKPDVVLQGNGIFLEHFSQTRPLPRVPQTITVTFRESAWRRADGQPCTREHLLMALAEVSLFMIRATYTDNMDESSISDIRMDVAVPHSTGNERALEVEECACPQGYRGPSCQECDEGYTRTSSGLYLGTCERCDCNGHAGDCDPETGREEKPSADSCGDPFQEKQTEGFLPVGCGPEAVYNFSWDKEIQYASGDEDSDDDFDFMSPVTTVIPTRTLLSTEAKDRTPQSTEAIGMGNGSVTPSRSTSRLPPRFTPSPERRHSSFQRLLRIHLNTFNQRLSMLESNTLDMKESIHSIQDQQSRLTSQLKELIVVQSAGEKNKKVGELEKGHTDMESRLSRLEGRLEILIDGFTALAQEMNKMKRARHVSRSPQERRALPSLATVLELPFYSTPPPPVRLIPTETPLTSRATVAKSIPTPGLPANKRTSAPKGDVPQDTLATRSLDRDALLATMKSMMNVDGPSCSNCKSGTFHLSQENKDGCLSCFCMGVTQQCSSSTYYRDQVSSAFTPGNFQGFALVNRQRTNRIPTGFTVEVSTEGTQLSYSNFDYLGQEPHYWQLPGVYQGDKYALVYKGFSLHQDDLLRWQLPAQFTGDKVGSYGGKLKYTISYVAGPRGTLLDDADVQIIGNDITLVARLPWQRRQQGSRETQRFEVVFREVSGSEQRGDKENWSRPDGMPATREHLMMVLADLDDVLIRASYSTEMRSSSISEINMEVAVPNYSGLAQALEVEQCRCPPGYQGLSCQDCAPGYTRTGGGLYLGHCELCECNGHSDSCHPETGICTSCLHNTQGKVCEQCAPGFFGDPTVGTPEDCQPCACPHADPDNQFSPTCESLGNGGYQCTACQPGYTGQYCERCAPGYVGNPQDREKCRPYDAAASLVVKVYPERVLASQGGPVTLRCQVSGSPPHYFYWSREDGRPISGSADRRRQGAELYFPSVQPSDGGVYVCTCRDQRSTNRSRAEIVVTSVPSKPIEVTVEEPKAQTVRVGSTVSFICTAKSKSPAYTLVWTRMGSNGKLPNRAMDFNGILTIQNVQPEDAGVYVCTGSNMFAMDEGNAILYVPGCLEATWPLSLRVMHALTFRSMDTLVVRIESEVQQPAKLAQTAVRPEAMPRPACHISSVLSALRMWTAKAGEGAQPVATISPSVLNAQQGQRAEFRCTVTGNPTPAIEWIGGPGNRMSPRAVIRGGVLTFTTVDPADAGEYTCKALNTHGEHTSRVSLFVQKSNPSGLGTQPQVQVSPQNIEVHEGESLRLYCRASGSPAPKLTWLKNGGQIPPQARMDRTDIGTLLIPNIKMSDSGTYMCVGSNSVGSNSAPVKVTVLKADHSSSVVSIQPSIADVQEGQSLELNCFAPGNPPPQVGWTRASGRLSSNHQCNSAAAAAVVVDYRRHFDHEDTTSYFHEPNPKRLRSFLQVLGSQLRILSAGPEDSGEYICRVQGTSGNPGSHVHQASVSVSVTSSSSRLQSPIIAIEPHSAAVRVGDSASFRCRVYSGAQPVRLEWKLANNQPLPDNVKVGADGSVLTITGARPANHGAYRCVASNPFGITHSIVSLIVKESPVATVTPVGPVQIRLGEPINLECQATGEPRPSVSWHRLDSNRKTMLSSPVPMESNAVMQILVARPEDSGTYVCTARNNEGSAETRVEVIVEGGSQLPSVPRASVPEPLMIVVEGQTATLRCEAHGFPSPTVTWSKLRSPLPWRHKLVNNSLVMPNVGRQDSGEYICGATNNMGTAEVTIMLDVETLPYATSVPDDVAVRVGEVIRLQCLAHGTPPLTYTWTKLDGSLSPRAQVSGGDLQINLATAEDAGNYKCVAGNKVGNSEVVAKVTVRSPLAVRVSPQVDVKAQGSAVEFTCSAAGGIETKIEWLKEGGALPPNHHVKDGVLRIENLEQSNEGVYICRASSVYGQAQDTARLTIQALPKVMINVRTSVQTVMIGNSVEFECQAVGDPEPTVQWSKVGGALPAHIMVTGGMLKIERVTEADAGQYRCTATNDVGSVQSQVVLNVQSLPQIAALPATKEVTVGSDAVLPCVASGYPVPEIKWSKLEGELPPKCFQEVNALTVPGVTHEDSGTYVCTASNKQGKVEAFTTLQVHERVMPYFAQEPLSYLTLPTIKNAYKAFSIKINFRPDSGDDSPYQYAAHFHDNGYIALPKSVFPRSAHDSPETIELEINTSSPEGLILWQGVETNGARNLRKVHAVTLIICTISSYQLGSGEAEILSRKSINDGRWHKVTAVRTGKDGYIQVDGGATLHGQSKGKSLMVNTKGSLYLGLTGCVRNLTLMNARPGQQPAQAIDLQAHAAHGINVQPCSS